MDKKNILDNVKEDCNVSDVVEIAISFTFPNNATYSKKIAVPVKPNYLKNIATEILIRQEIKSLLKEFEIAGKISNFIVKGKNKEDHEDLS